jgi:hypothetical protein
MVLSLLCLISFFYALPYAKFFSNLASGNKILTAMALRFHAMQPVFWFLLVAISVKLLFDFFKRNIKIYVIVYCLLFLQLFFSLFSVSDSDWSGTEFVENTFYRTYFDKNNPENQSFNDYYRINLFAKVERFVNKKDYIACLGFTPEIAQYNGFKTIDGYFPLYPEKHKIIMETISKRELVKLGISSFGRRSLLISEDIKLCKDKVIEPQWDFNLMKKIKVKWVFSIKPINSKNLTFYRRIINLKEKIYIYYIK